MHLGLGDLDDFLAVPAQLVLNAPALLLIVDGIQADHGKLLCYAHHYIGMIDRQPFSVHRLVGRKNDRGHIKILTELNEKALIGPVRKRAVGLLMDTVHDDAPGTLQKQAVLFGGGIINDLPDDKTLFLKDIQDILPPFLPPVFGKHGINHHPSAFVKRHPVIGENGIGGIGFQPVIHHNYPDPGLPESSRKGVEFLLRLPVDL